MNACRRMLVLTSAVLWLGATWATDGVWSNLTTGLWSDPANWRNGSVGGGVGASVVIAPGFGGERPENRMMEIPDAGVTLGSLVYEVGDPMGAIRIWGGPLTFDGNGGEARIRGCVDPATGGVALNVLSEVHATGDLHLESVTLGSIAHHTGDTYLDNGSLNLYFVCYADRPSSAATNYLPATCLYMGPNTGIYSVSRGSSGEYSATFTLTEGSDLITTSVNANRCIGAPISGDGIPDGTFVKCAITENHIQISQPATKSGDSILSVGGIPGGLTSLQQFQKMVLSGYTTLDVQSHQGSNMRIEVGELTGSGTLNKRGSGTLALGVGTNYVGALNVTGGMVELTALTGTDPSFTHLQLGGCTFNLANPDAIVSADVLEGGAGRVVKTGPGTLQVGRLAAGTGQMQLEVKEGAVEIGHGGGVSACPVKGAWLHVDAMARDSMTVVEENGTNFVTRWNDCDGGANYAAVNASALNGARPWISTNYFGGLPVLDFGTLHYQDNGVVLKDGYGASMDWNVRDSGIREVFLVCADTKETLDSDDRTRQFLLGDPGFYAFHRGIGEKLFIQYTDANIRGGLIEVDGAVVPPADCEQYELAAGFHLIHLRTTGNVVAGAFARNRDLGFGGQRLAEVFVAAGRTVEADALRARSDAECDAVNRVFWDERIGLYRATTVKCREHDVWGSAFAVWLGVAPNSRADRIAAYFRDNFDGLVRNGQVRHCTAGVYWEQGCTRDSYQNGGFWGTPVAWFAYTLERSAPAKVDRLYRDLFAYYRAHGVCEWFFGSTIAIPEGYLASVAQPLVGLHRIVSARRK